MARARKAEGRLKVGVTGGAGQLGRALEHVLGGTRDVLLWPRTALDVTDRDAVRRRLSADMPDVVVHAAAMTNVDGCEADAAGAFRANALGALHVAEAAEEIGARLVHISSDFVFDGEKARPYTEVDAPRPLSVYGESKLAGEEYVLRAAKRALVVRTAWLYGPGERNFVDTILQAGAAGKRLTVVADQAGSPTWTRDLASGVGMVLDAGLAGVVHIVNGGQATRYELARRALDLAGLERAVVIPVTTEEMPRPAKRPRHAILVSRILPAAGIEPLRHWEEALADHVALRAARERGAARGTA